MKPTTRNRILAGLAAIFATVLVLGTLAHSRADEQEPYKRMTVDEVQQRLGHKDVFIYDNNSKEQFAAGHVPGAKWVEFDGVTASDLPASKDATLVFYCGGEMCSACHVAAKTATKLGYINVYIMPAGRSGWEKAGKPFEKS